MLTLHLPAHKAQLSRRARLFAAVAPNVPKGQGQDTQGAWGQAGQQTRPKDHYICDGEDICNQSVRLQDVPHTQCASVLWQMSVLHAFGTFCHTCELLLDQRVYLGAKVEVVVRNHGSEVSQHSTSVDSRS